MKTIAERVAEVRKRIAAAAGRSGRSPGEVRLVAVSKTVDAERVKEAVAAGVTIFGENRVQEAREKIPLVGGDVEWHMIGRLQKNKAKYVPALFTMVHSVDGVELARALDRAMEKAAAGGLEKSRLDVLIQVNVAGEESKAGVTEDETAELVREVSKLPFLQVKGLMTIPPYSENPEDSRGYFKKLKLLRDRIASMAIPGASMDELSMGMSGDFEVAVEEGATLVRVGSAIFGERHYG